jgi:hypothetical protein
MSEAATVALCFFAEAAADTPGVVRFENTLHVVVLGVHCDFLFCISSFAYLQPR